MSIYTIEYETKEERTSAISLAQGKRHQMLRDEYETGKDGKNVLVFEDSPDLSDPPIIPPTVDDIRRNELEDKARNDQPMTTAELREMFKLKFLT